jgi:hypothetical protein
VENDGSVVVYAPGGAVLWTTGTSDGSGSSGGSVPGDTIPSTGPPEDATPMKVLDNGLSFVDAIENGVHVAPGEWSTYAAASPLPSCAAYTQRGNVGYITTQVVPPGYPEAGYLHWAVRMHNIQDELGPWWVDVFVNGVLRDRKTPVRYVLYGPHGSLPPTIASAGSTVQIKAIHHYFALIPTIAWGGPEIGYYLTWILGVQQATGALACRMP